MKNTTLLKMYYKNWVVSCGLLDGMDDDEYETATKTVIVDLLRNGWTKNELIQECRMLLDRLNPKRIGGFLMREEMLSLTILALFKDDDVRIDSMDLGVNADPYLKREWRVI